jgi:VWFA-related protein
VITFVRERLLPQDQVAVVAFNRATDFTTDRGTIVKTLEELRQRHKLIEAELSDYFRGLRAAYGDTEPPAYIQKEIDAVFYADRLARALPPAGVTDAQRQADDRRRAIEALEQADVTANRPPGASLDAFAAVTLNAGQDIKHIYAAIAYLRYLDGEKHLVFVTEGGILLPRRESDEYVAALASDARVVIHTIQTGGVMTIGMNKGKGSASMARVSGNQLISEQVIRNIADMTGGLSTSGSSSKILERIDKSSRAQYLLGYAPSNAAWDGAFRRIRVKVNRPNVRVLYRQGYYAPQESLSR